MAIVSEGCEVGRHEVIRDARTVWTWQGPADDLVEYVYRSHDWPANMGLSYLATLQRTRLWNQAIDAATPAIN